MNVNDPNVIAVATVVTIVAGTIAIVEFVWKPIRGFLYRGDSPPATKADTDALSQQIKVLEARVTQPPTYLDGLPEDVNATLRAAYEEARILQLEGYEARSTEKHREAIERFTRALALAENDSQRAALHNLRGNSYFDTSDYVSAQAEYEQSLGLADGITPAEDAARARAAALGGLGNVYKDCGDLDRAKEYHQQALKLHGEARDRRGEACDLSNLGFVYRRGSELNDAEEHHKRALKIDKEIGNRLGEASDLSGLGNVYFQRGGPGDLHKAEKHHKQALKIHRQIGNRLGEATDLSNLGTVYGQRGELDKAEQCFENALVAAKEIGNRVCQANALGNLGSVYRLRDGPGDLDKAEKHHKQALEMAREIGDRLGEAQDLGNLGLVYFRRRDPRDLDEAEEHFRHALAIHKEIGNRLGEALDLGNLGLVYLHHADPEEAREHLQQAQAIFRETGARGEGPEAVRQGLEYLQELERRREDGEEEV